MTVELPHLLWNAFPFCSTERTFSYCNFAFALTEAVKEGFLFVSFLKLTNAAAFWNYLECFKKY